MKVYKIYEKIYSNAGKFKEKIYQNFFDELEEFENIYYETTDEGENFRFQICFTEVYKETVEQMEKFNVFMGFAKDVWCFKLDDDKYVIYEDFYLGTEKVDNYLEKFEIIDKSKKYNL